MLKRKKRLVPKMTRLESRAWDIMAERSLTGKPVCFEIAYAAAVEELARRKQARKSK
jgi:hypothetical protein